MPTNICGTSLMLKSLTWTPSALAAPWANYPIGVFLLLSVVLHAHSSLSTQTLSLSPLSQTIVIGILSPSWMTTHQWCGLHLCTLKMVSTQFKMQVEQWMSDAGGEYKSKAFDLMLKEQGICILQSAPHTPQQNSCAEQFMCTVMDKSEAMHHEACIPESWWEFSIAHATHVYNCTPLCRHN